LYKRICFIIGFFVLNSVSLLFGRVDNGVFLWPSTFYDYGGIDNIINTLQDNKISDVFLLVKGEAGATFFPSDYTFRDFYYK